MCICTYMMHSTCICLYSALCVLQIQLSLQSCGTKVAETLSLLWAGLPDPKSDSSTSLVAWHQLVLPFLCKVTSCPKQVLSYCLNYTSLLLRYGLLPTFVINFVFIQCYFAIWMASNILLYCPLLLPTIWMYIAMYVCGMCVATYIWWSGTVAIDWRAIWKEYAVYSKSCVVGQCGHLPSFYTYVPIYVHVYIRL